MRSRAHPILVRETEDAACRCCGRGGSIWEHAIPIGDAVAAIASDPEVLESMDTGACRCCGDPYEWDVVIAASNGDRAAGAHAASRRVALVVVIRAQLALGRRPDAIAGSVRSELGVVGVLVEDRSTVGRRLGCDWTN